MTALKIYTDGACSGNQNEENLGGWGAILGFGPHQKELFGSEKNTTNNRMEMMALIEAMNAIKRESNDRDLLRQFLSHRLFSPKVVCQVAVKRLAHRRKETGGKPRPMGKTSPLFGPAQHLLLSGEGPCESGSPGDQQRKTLRKVRRVERESLYPRRF